MCRMCVRHTHTHTSIIRAKIHCALPSTSLPPYMPRHDTCEGSPSLLTPLHKNNHCPHRCKDQWILTSLHIPSLCCSVLQCVAVCCSVLHLKWILTSLHIPSLCCSVLQCVAVCCSVLQWKWMLTSLHIPSLTHFPHTCRDPFQLQHTATHCNTLQHTATHRNTLQHTATHCNALQHHFPHTCKDPLLWRGVMCERSNVERESVCTGVSVCVGVYV